MNIISCFLLWTIFGLQHSLLARPFFKNFLKNYFGNKFERYLYPLIYFISQCIIFLAIYDAIRNLKTDIIFYEIPSNYKFIIYYLNRLSNLFLIVSVFHFDVGLFTGFTQFLKFFRKPLSQDNLKQNINNSYLYKYIRHPMYLGILLVFLTSTTIYSDLFLINLVSIIFYIDLGSFFEEKTLVRKFGNSYNIYKMRTKKYLPLLR